IRDTSHVSVFIDESRIAYSDPLVQPQLKLFSEGEKRAELVLYPEFKTGNHTATFLVNDAFGNRAVKSVSVKVSGEMALIDALNYPNPFDRETEFTFTLTQPAEEIRIKIYTVAGRLIQTLETFAATPGFNRIRWDGRDADGDESANGVYLYKIIARQGEKQVERIEKLAVAR
ncbi:MAG: FlgD immunoglobulin-like domain containing protein, partial [bacterium]